MIVLATGASAPIDYWYEVVRRGVLALGFSILRFKGEAWMAAHLANPQEGLVRRAAHAAIEIDKRVALETGSPENAAREALAARLERRPASLELAGYQRLLLDRLWSDIETDPAARLEALAYPHEHN